MGLSAMSASSSVARSPLSMRRLMMSVGRGSCPCSSSSSSSEVRRGQTQGAMCACMKGPFRRCCKQAAWLIIGGYRAPPIVKPSRRW